MCAATELSCELSYGKLISTLRLRRKKVTMMRGQYKLLAIYSSSSLLEEYMS